MSVSGMVVCFNEEKRIRACLESLSWCDEIVVVDSHSTDGTVEIARELTDRVIIRAWPGHREQKQFALDQTRCDWVMNLDADETASPDLQREILALFEKGIPVDYDGFKISRIVRYLGQWWYRGGWFPDYCLRLIRRERASWGGTNPHERAVVQGEIGRLDGLIHHYTYPDIQGHMKSVNFLTDVAARELVLQRAPIGPSKLFLRPTWRFLRSLLLHRGALEGRPGYFVAATAAFYVFLKYQKARELQRAELDLT